jgi:hypothetical protein
MQGIFDNQSTLENVRGMIEGISESYKFMMRMKDDNDSSLQGLAYRQELQKPECRLKNSGRLPFITIKPSLQHFAILNFS